MRRRLRLLGGVMVFAAGLAWPDVSLAMSADDAFSAAQRTLADSRRSVSGIRSSMAKARVRSRTPARRLADGDLLLRSRDYERAAIVFNEIVEKYPNHQAVYAEALFSLGETYHKSGQLLSARRTYSRVVEEGQSGRLAPYRARALARLTDIAIRTRDLKALDDLYTKMNAIPSSSVEEVLSYARGRVLMEKADTAGARQAFQGVGPKSRYHHQAKYLLGVVALREAKAAAAAKAAPAEGTEGEAKEPTKDRRAMRGVYAPAIQAFRQVTQLPGDTAEHKHVIDLAWLAVGRLLFETDQWRAAAEAYNHVERTSPEFGRMLYELATAYVQLGDVQRAQRALEVLAIADPESRDIAEASLLRGELQLRAGQFDKAMDTFEGVRSQFDPMRDRVDGFLNSTSDPAVYYDKLVQEQLDILDQGAPLPPLAVEWAREEEDGPEAFGVVDEVVQTRKLLKRSKHLVQRLQAVMNSPNRIKAFPELRAGERSAVAILNGVMRARGMIGTGLDDVEDSSVSGELAGVRAERRALQAKVLRLPVSNADFESRDAAAVRRWNQTSQKVQQLELQVDTLQAVINALRRVLREGSTRGVVRDPASSRKLEEDLVRNEREVEMYRRKLEELRRMVDMGKITSGFEDPRVFDDRDVRTRFKAALAREVQLVRRGGAGQRAASFASKVSPLLTRADRVDAEVETVRNEIAQQADKKTREVLNLINQEQQNMAEYATRLEGLDQEARLLVGEVAMRNFGLVRDRLRNVVLRADVGITEQAWEVREEQLTRVRNLQSERARVERLLNEELREVLDDMVDE